MKKVIIISAAALVLLFLLWAVFFSGIDYIDTEETLQQGSSEATSAETTLYSLEEWELAQEVSGTNPETGVDDTKIYLRNRITGETHGLLASTYAFKKTNQASLGIEEVSVKYGTQLGIVGEPTIGDTFFFYTIWEFGGPIYSFNINTLEARKLQNVWLGGDERGQAGWESSDGKSIIVFSRVDDQDPRSPFFGTLSIGCLVEDELKTIEELPVPQIFNEAFPELGGGVDIEWLDGETVRYNIYTVDLNERPFTYEDTVNYVRTETERVPVCN